MTMSKNQLMPEEGEDQEREEPMSKPLPGHVPYVILNNGVAMPQEGFGVFQIPKAEECQEIVDQALDVGYRLIDTAQFYHNEAAVGLAVEESGIKREEVFLTTKVWVSNFGYDKTIDSVERSLSLLRTDYLDLVLLHQSVGNYLWAYRALEDLYHEGKIRAIGVSNMENDRLLDLAGRANVVPAVNQVENHVFFQQKESVSLMKQNGIQPEAWAPMAEGKKGIFTNPLLIEIGDQYNKTAAQVALRYVTQQGTVIIPKSSHRDRMEQNLDIWDFTLSANDMAQIETLDGGRSLFGYARMFSGIQKLGLLTAKKKPAAD
nr:aldo/keto reductase [Scardovia inopinata]